MTYSKRFSSKFFAPLLKPAGNNPQRDRASSFTIVFEELDKMNKEDYTIVETGCMRADHGDLAFGDDGASTYIFDDFINYYDGQVISVDICQANVDYANGLTSNRTTAYCEDSVSFLWNMRLKSSIDFLYLDSYDIERDNPHPSQLHHVKELCAVIRHLRKGSIVCVDDHDAFFTGGKIGKGNYVKEFMDAIGAECIHENYQIIWRM